MDDRVAPSRETEAEASFLAAITNAHCAQSYDVVQYFFQRALQHSRHVGQFMLDYMELQTQRSVPPRMSETEEQMWKAESPLMRNLLRLNRKRLDRMLLKVTIDALEEAGFKARERLESICLDEHSVTHDTTDLLDYLLLFRGGPAAGTGVGASLRQIPAGGRVLPCLLARVEVCLCRRNRLRRSPFADVSLAETHAPRNEDHDQA